MNGKSNLFVALTVVFAVSLISTGINAVAFAESSIPFRGTFEGHDLEGDDYSGTFVDWGTYSVFDGLVKASGTYQFVEDPTLELGGYYTTEYTLSDGLGNILQFENREVSWTEYANGKFGMAQDEWKIVGGEGKFEGATGEGIGRVWFNLEDMSYKGTMSGTIFLS